ncbi:MAG: hypothetical protein QXV22_01680 [Thermoplasmataceae archaeon]
MAVNPEELIKIIQATKRFRELDSISRKIDNERSGMSNEDFQRVHEAVENQMKKMDNPPLERATITIIMMNGSKRLLTTDEVRILLNSGESLSEFIFTHFPMASDYEVSISESQDHREAPEDKPKTVKDVEVKSLIKKLDSLAKMVGIVEEAYSSTVPGIKDDLAEIRRKILELIAKLQS